MANISFSWSLSVTFSESYLKVGDFCEFTTSSPNEFGKFAAKSIVFLCLGDLVI